MSISKSFDFKLSKQQLTAEDKCMVEKQKISDLYVNYLQYAVLSLYVKKYPKPLTKKPCKLIISCKHTFSGWIWYAGWLQHLENHENLEIRPGGLENLECKCFSVENLENLEMRVYYREGFQHCFTAILCLSWHDICVFLQI